MFYLKGLRASLIGSLHLSDIQRVEQQKLQQEGHATRLADLELLLSALASKTEVCSSNYFIFQQKSTLKTYCRIHVSIIIIIINLLCSQLLSLHQI